ncbi:CgeB family protein [Cohnella yongneupensis]|uniref:Glycosyltransferase n=1 Tax=Cohnella yongneupensis TaxID=425006 RepID=A0ABW0QW23_9BACL
MAAWRIRSRRQARSDAYALGWSHGHWFGRCEVARQRAMPLVVKRPLHVMYVTSGKGYPYSPLDFAIQETLKEVATRVTIAEPKQDIAFIASQARPDLMLVLDGMNLPPEKVTAVRALGIKTAIWFTDDPYYTDITAGIAPHYDCVFTLERNCLPFYQTLGCARVYYLPLGVFPPAFRPFNPRQALRGDITFIGSAYWNRVYFFERLIPLIARHKLYISGLWWDRLSNYTKYKGHFDHQAWQDPSKTCERYNANKIVINAHRSTDDESYNMNKAKVAAVSPNPRTFEISASGTLQMTDMRQDLEQFYVPGVEVVTYDSPQDLANKAEYYLHHESERQEIALRGLYRTMRDHTYASRLNQLFDVAMSP